MRKLMAIEITDNERMIAFLAAISENNDHWKPQQKREYIKLLGIASEIFEDALIPFMPKILPSISKKLKEGGSQLHGAISETLGEMTKNLLAKIDNEEDLEELTLNVFLKFPLQLLEKSPN